ncbi:hypothetical protein [Rosistilla oblonga]|uniref:hypothetical protein n=1 Tax=Rosistilla oblonga TaxID=2527990 RepID=UPI003A9699CE
MRRPAEDDDDGGLDSLLDTMTNVVGILVLVLIVTQMSVTEVVTRIRSETVVDAEKLEQAKKELAEKEEEKNELERILVAPQDIDADKQKEELQKLKDLLARQKKAREDAKKEQEQYALKIEQQQKAAEEAKKKIAETTGKREELTKLISTSLDRKAQIEAMLDKTPIRARPADIKVSIPNPRPAPPGAKQASFLCSGNAVYPINAEAFRERAVKIAKAIVARGNMDRDPKVGIDPEKFTAIFAGEKKDQDAFFDVEYYVQSNRYPRMRFHPREKRGAVATALLNKRSVIRRDYLSNLDVTKYYARFYVLPDSFDIYLTARGIFQDAGMLAGWDPQPQDWLYTTHVGGVELGPPLPKNPNPPPPRKPQSVID